MAGYNTNLASEFYVLSMLFRMGLDANLTLGNKKSVDITIVRGPSDVITVDVKAVAKCMDWPIGSRAVLNPDRHFLALICYNGKFTSLDTAPDTWIVPYHEVKQKDFSKKFKGDMTCVIRRRLVERGDAFRENWNQLASE